MSYIFLGALLMASSLAEISDAQEAPAPSTDNGHATDSADTTGSTLDFVPKYFKVLDGSQFEKLRSSPSVGAVYFYKHVRVVYSRISCDYGMREHVCPLGFAPHFFFSSGPDFFYHNESQ